MPRRGNIKCLFCGVLFVADARNAQRQRYCSAVSCRKASKVASQRAWLTKPENQDYFCGPEHVSRVQAWRADHPGYWRRTAVVRAATATKPAALQDSCPPQAIESIGESGTTASAALQDLMRDQPAVLIGFIAQFTGSALQNDIARSARRLVELGHDILAGRAGDEHQPRASV